VGGGIGGNIGEKRGTGEIRTRGVLEVVGRFVGKICPSHSESIGHRRVRAGERDLGGDLGEYGEGGREEEKNGEERVERRSGILKKFRWRGM
jgi:hypothetical protein